MWNKVLGVFAAIAAGAAMLFYFLFNREKLAATKAVRTQELDSLKNQVDKVAEAKHEEIKKQGPEAVADDTDRMLTNSKG